MPAGIEVYNDGGRPQVLNLGFNMQFQQKGTVTRPSNTAATGFNGAVSLPQTTGFSPYLIFVRSGGYVAVVSASSNGFTYHMGQGNLSFEWWAFTRAPSSGNSGLQVFDESQRVIIDFSQRPLALSNVIKTTGNMPYAGERPSVNTTTGNPTYQVPAGTAWAFSNPGFIMSLYTGAYNTMTLTPDAVMRPAARLTNTTLEVAGIRFRDNAPTLGSNVRYQSYVAAQPTWILTMDGF